MFSPLAFPEGLVVYDLSTTLPPASHLALTAFEIYRQPFVVIGIIDGQQRNDSEGVTSADLQEEGCVSVSDSESLQRSLDNIRSDFQEAFLYQLFVFDSEDVDLDVPRDVVCVPRLEKSRSTTVKTIMCDLTSKLLGEMAPFAKQLQTQPSLESPKAFQSMNTPTGLSSALLNRQNISSGIEDRARSSSPAGDAAKSSHRASLPARMLSNKGSRPPTPAGRMPSPPYGDTASREEASRRSQSRTRRPSAERPRAESQDRGVQQYESSNIRERERIRGRSRIGVVVGSMYLLAGRWPDAVKELVQSANAARANSDYVWQAKALDYLLVCHLMYAWAGMDFRVSLQIDEYNLCLFFELLAILRHPDPRCPHASI